MKVLMLGWEGPPPHHNGGLGVVCYQLCKALAQRGADIDFILPYTAQYEVGFMRYKSVHPQDIRTLLKAGIVYDSAKYITKNGQTGYMTLFEQVAMYEHAIEGILDEVEFDVVHAHDWLTCRAALRVQELTGKPLYVHFHSIESDRAGGKPFAGNPLVREIEELAVHLADRVIAVSELTKQGIVREYGVPAHKVEVVHNSMDISELAPLDNASAYPYILKMKEQGYRVVVYVGRVTVQKGLTNLLRAAKEVVARAPKTLFLIVGSGDQDQEMLELAAAEGIAQNVIFTGFLRGKPWRDAFGTGDLFVMPSVSEPFGITPLEAIGYGTPPLISKQSGLAEVLQNALKVDFWDINEMANKIHAVVTNDALRDTLQMAAYQEFEKMHWGDAAEKLMTLYEQPRKAVAV
jgi:glycogen synthase